MWTPGLPGVRPRVSPRTSSTPRPYERRVSRDPLLASAPDGLSPANHDRSPLQVNHRGPPPPQDEASTLACGAHGRLTGRPRVSAPVKDHNTGCEQGLTARPSPSHPIRVPHKGLSEPMEFRPRVRGPQAHARTTRRTAVRRPRRPPPASDDTTPGCRSRRSPPTRPPSAPSAPTPAPRWP